jgi:hypothetical protein
MASRPIFLPTRNEPLLAREVRVEFHWHPGMAMSQKRKNVTALHEAAAEKGFAPLLEISSASEVELGRRLSAFNLKVFVGDRDIPFESAYQGSKVFLHGGPYFDLYDVDARTAKRDPRLRSSGRIVGFQFLDERFPSNPPTAFYDWMYICTLYPHAEWLERNIGHFAGFTDIAFNPERSLNCQARACAILLSLQRRRLLGFAAESFSSFLQFAEATEAGWSTTASP